MINRGGGALALAGATAGAAEQTDRELPLYIPLESPTSVVFEGQDSKSEWIAWILQDNKYHLLY